MREWFRIWATSWVIVGSLVGLGPSRVNAETPRAATPADDRLLVELDTSAVPELQEWGNKAKQLIEQWYQRIANLLPTKGFTPPKRVVLRFRKSDSGIAGTGRNTITVMSGWVQKHPEDIGLVAHELVHVIQSYPRRSGPGWITEGIADYIRWAIYEAKPPQWFPIPRTRDGKPRAQGYRQSYRVAGGFFLWLEGDLAPGIVKKVNTAMRQRTYSDAIFKEETGYTLDELWEKYLEARGQGGG